MDPMMYFVNRDIQSKGEVVLRRGEVVDVVGIGEIVGIEGADGVRVAILSGDPVCVPIDAVTHCDGLSATIRRRAVPLFILHRRDKALLGPTVALLRLEYPVKKAIHFPLNDLLDGLEFTQQQLADRIREQENQDLIFVQNEHGRWSEVYER
jgi:hypothetical protein